MGIAAFSGFVLGLYFPLWYVKAVNQHGEYREPQRPAFTRPLPQHTSQRTCARFHLFGQWHQAAGADRVFRSIRGFTP